MGSVLKSMGLDMKINLKGEEINSSPTIILIRVVIEPAIKSGFTYVNIIDICY